MNSYRAAVLVVASALLALSASEASACSCKEVSTKESFASSDLVVRGRMKLVTYGVEMPGGGSDGETIRMTRGEFEIQKVLKGTFKGKNLSMYTGSGMGDCGRLGDFIASAYNYSDKKFVVEFGLSKADHAGETLYFTSICDYIKGPKDGQQ